jgi:hypothetical protein
VLSAVLQVPPLPHPFWKETTKETTETTMKKMDRSKGTYKYKVIEPRKEVSFESRVAGVLSYVVGLFLLIVFYYSICRPQVARFKWGAVIYPPVVLANSPLKVTVYLPDHNTEGSKYIWPKLTTLRVDEACPLTHSDRNRAVFMPVPETSSPSERTQDGKEGSARTAFPVFEYTGVVMGCGNSWITIRIFAPEREDNTVASSDALCSLCFLDLLGNSKVIQVYVVEIPLSPPLLEAVMGAGRNFFLAIFLLVLIIPLLILLPRELRGLKETLLNMLR